MLKVRVIPCLDVKDGRVVKGVRFVDLRDAGDPVEIARPMTPPAPTSCASSTSPRATRTAAFCSTWSRRTAEQCFMPLTVGGGVRSVEDIRAAAAGRRRQGLDQHRRGATTRSWSPTPPANSAPSASWSRSMPSGCPRCRCAALRGLHPWRAQSDRPRRRGICARRWRHWCRRDPADLDGPRRHRRRLRPRAGRAPSPTPSAIPVIASGGVGTLDHLVEGVRDGHASAVLAASIFHFGTYTIAEAKARLAAAGIPVRGRLSLHQDSASGSAAARHPGQLASIIAAAAAPHRMNPIPPSCWPKASRNAPKRLARRLSKWLSRRWPATGIGSARRPPI